MPQVIDCLARPFRRFRSGVGPRSVGAALLALCVAAGPAAAQFAVTTHQYNVMRTGWNRNETVLTPANVGTPGPDGTFGLLQTIPVDGYMDAQPLIVPNVVVEGDPNPGTHDVAYLATQNDTVYAVDPTRGTVLLSRNFGTPVPQSRGCLTYDIGVGITGTPVIDIPRHTLYVVTFTNELQANNKYLPFYRLHALDLSTLADRVPPVVITAQQTLENGTTLLFHPVLHRQRPALLEYNAKIYVTMGSFCDDAPARGWVMSYGAETLKPLEANANGVQVPFLTNHGVTAPYNYFLSALWMSGAGPAADETGIYYVTANSDPSGTTYDPVENPEHSIVRMSADTMSVLDVFTPQNLVYLDQQDQDFGAGGIVLLPSTRPDQPPMAAAAGKFGTLYLVDRTHLGGYTPGGPDKVLAEVPIGSCRCTSSYFDDGTPTIVSSGGKNVMLWQVKGDPTTSLVQRASATIVSTDTGFFTSVSSDAEKNTIVWAVSRPLRPLRPGISLYAYGVNPLGQPLTTLFVGDAGIVGEYRHLSNTVPVVANGRVYVVSDNGLEVFGLAPPAAAPAAN